MLSADGRKKRIRSSSTSPPVPKTGNPPTTTRSWDSEVLLLDCLICLVVVADLGYWLRGQVFELKPAGRQTTKNGRYRHRQPLWATV